MPQRTPHLLKVVIAVTTLWIFFSQPEELSKSKLAESTWTTPVNFPPIIQAQTGSEAGYISYVAPLLSSAPEPPSQSSQISRLLLDEALIPLYSNMPPGLLDFVVEVANGEKDLVRGVFVQDVLALQVVQQPPKDAADVTEEFGFATQFQSAAHYGVIGLLAHNYLSGQLFYHLEVGQTVYLVMGDGKTQRYIVNEIARYKKMDPSSLRSNLVDLSDGKTYTTPQVFTRYYRKPHKVTFQTCLEGEGRLNWGLIFITAVPVEE